jgi:hypothetical protein
MFDSIKSKLSIEEWNFLQNKLNLPAKQFYACPDCGQNCDGDSKHLSPSGKECLTVLGRRGWRKLGDYDS